MNNIVLFIYGKVQNQRLNKRKTMKNLILIILITFSFSTDLSWWKGNHNPNGKTGMISIRTPLFDSQNDTEFLESRLTAYTITLTDFITMQYSIQNLNSREGIGDWQKSTINNTEVYLHLPLYKLWE